MSMDSVPGGFTPVDPDMQASLERGSYSGKDSKFSLSNMASTLRDDVFSKDNMAKVGTAVTAAVAIPIGAAVLVAAAPFLAAGGLGFLAYKAAPSVLKTGKQAGEKLMESGKAVAAGIANIHTRMQDTAISKGYTGDNPVKDFVKHEACKVAGKIGNFFTQRLPEAVPLDRAIRSTLTQGVNQQIKEIIALGNKYESAICSDSDKDFIVSLDQFKNSESGEIDAQKLSDDKLRRLNSLHVKIKEREKVFKELEKIDFEYENFADLNNLPLSEKDKENFKEIFKKMNGIDLPSPRPLSADEVEKALHYIDEIKFRSEINNMVDILQRDSDFLSQEDKQTLTRLANEPNPSPAAIDNLKDLYTYYRYVKKEGLLDSANKYYNLHQKIDVYKLEGSDLELFTDFSNGHYLNANERRTLETLPQRSV